MTTVGQRRAPTVVIRVDGGGRVGYGHLMRMLGLALTLRTRHRAVVHFAIRGDAACMALVDRHGFERVTMSDQAYREASEDAILIAVARRYPRAVLVVDHPFAFSADAFSTVRKSVSLAVVQSEYEAAWSCDLMVFPAGHHSDDVLRRCARRARAGRPCLAGLDFVMLAEQALRARATERPPFVALAAGGSDPFGLLPRWRSLLENAEVGLPIVALAGSGSQHPIDAPASTSSTIQTLPFRHDLLFSARLAVVAFGVTAYELVYRRIPTLTAGHSARATDVSDRFAARYGATRSIGDGRTIDRERLVAAVRAALDPSALSEVRQRQAGLIDGQGTERVADAIVALSRETT